MSEKRQIYADNAATTPVSASVMQAMMPYFSSTWGNPSGLYSQGREAAKALYEAREKTASSLGCAENEIYFTSGGTEADNWAIKGYARANADLGRHIIASAIEHPAVLNSLEALKKDGFIIDLVMPDSLGVTHPEDYEKLIRRDTILICCMAANNELGTIQPIKEISDMAHRHHCAFFSDAVQGIGAISVDLRELGADMLSFSGHKIHAPKGIGALYIKSGTKIKNLIDGGGQQRGMRAGTENVPYIVGLSQAVQDAVADESKNEYILGLRKKLEEGLLEIPHSRINGRDALRLPGIVNITFDCVESESLLLVLDMAGISVSAGSACSSRSVKPSHVLKAIGLDNTAIKSSVRYSLGDINTPEEVEIIIEQTKAAVERLRKLSPNYNG